MKSKKEREQEIEIERLFSSHSVSCGQMEKWVHVDAIVSTIKRIGGDIRLLGYVLQRRRCIDPSHTTDVRSFHHTFKVFIYFSIFTFHIHIHILFNNSLKIIIRLIYICLYNIKIVYIFVYTIYTCINFFVKHCYDYENTLFHFK